MTTSGADIAVLANPRAGRGRHRGLLPAVVDRLGAGGAPVRLLVADSSEGMGAAGDPSGVADAGEERLP